MIWSIIIIFIIGLDQLTKYLISTNIELGEGIEIVKKVFYITHCENTGAAWGILQNGRVIFIPITIIAVIVMVFYLFKIKEPKLQLPLSFIIGGAIGNLADRIFKGIVIDFIDFFIGSYHYPTFNLADSFIVVGSILLGYYIIFVHKHDDQKKEKKEEIVISKL